MTFYPVTPTSQIPPSLGDRFLARLIDSGILIGGLVLAGAIGQALGEGNPAGAVLAVFAFVALYGYEFVLIGLSGQTVGKRVMKLRVVSVSGGPLGWGGAAGRSFVPMLANCVTCGFAGLLFYVSPMFDNGPWKRGWHDQIASSVVVRAPGSGERDR
jgi:uncharacterized RDD family membrane protein YckC